MAIIRHKGEYVALDAAALERWKGVPPAVAGDCLNRTASMRICALSGMPAPFGLWPATMPAFMRRSR